MKKHPTDLFALLIGLAFAITGVGLVIAQATDSGVSGRAEAAAGLIILGVVALTATLLRNRASGPAGAIASDPAGADPSGSDDLLSPWDRAG